MLQLLVVSRVMKYLGVGVGLYILPLVALGGYGTLAIAPALSMVFLTKVAENGLDYSLQSTAAPGPVPAHRRAPRSTGPSR